MVRFENPNDFHRHELSAFRMTETIISRLPPQIEARVSDYARNAQCSTSIVIRHALYEYLMTRGIDCSKPIGCI